MNRWPDLSIAMRPEALAPDVAGQSASARQLPASALPERLHLPLAPPLYQRRLQVYVLMLLADAVAIVAGFSLAGFLYFGEWFDSAVMLEAQLIVPIYWTAAIGNRAYSAACALDPLAGGARALLALAIAAAMVVFLAFYLKSTADFSRVISAAGTLLSATGLLIARDHLSRFVVWRCGPTAANQLVVHDGGRRLDLPHSFTLDAQAHALDPNIGDPHALNRIGLFLRNMDRVVVSCTPDRRKAWSQVLKGANIQGEIVDDEMQALGVIGASHTPHYAALVVATGPLGISNRVMKRGLDIGLSLIALVLFAPLLLVTALAIKLEDGGPAFFNQRRLGRGNRFFTMYKFRSMREGDADGAVSTARDDDRVTRIGRFIRSTSIDELPQLLNVLKGEMSLVGPRPHALASQAGDKLFWEVDERYWQRHSLKPGLTGLAQVRGFRGATEREQDLASRLQADLEYIDGWTIWRDLGILAATLRVVIHQNAY